MAWWGRADRLLDGVRGVVPLRHPRHDFLVHPQQMLTSAHDAGLDGGRTVLDSGNGVLSMPES